MYDTCFGADLTVLEEGREFLDRYSKMKTCLCLLPVVLPGSNMLSSIIPIFYHTFQLCRSPQQMFGAICKDQLVNDLGISREDLVVVSIMPCTAKKFEARRDEFKLTEIRMSNT